MIEALLLLLTGIGIGLICTAGVVFVLTLLHVYSRPVSIDLSSERTEDDISTEEIVFPFSD